MASFKTTLAAIAATAVIGAAGVASANPLTGTFAIDVRTGNAGGNANLTVATAANYFAATDLGNITYTGAINFNLSGSQTFGGYAANTIGSFLYSAGGTVTGGANLSSILNTTLSGLNFTTTTILNIVLGAPATTSYLSTISHDDGITLFANGVAVTPASAAFPTTDVNTNAAITAGNLYNLEYVETNGLPADLDVEVPEPASLALLGAGLAGIGMIRRRRANAA